MPHFIAVVKWTYHDREMEEIMILKRSPGKKAANVEAKLKKRVRALEKDVEKLTAKVGKKESEIRKIKDKMKAKLKKKIGKETKEGKKKVLKIFPRIG